MNAVEPPKKWRYVALDFVLDNFKSIMTVVVVVGTSWWSMTTTIDELKVRVTELEQKAAVEEETLATVVGVMKAKGELQ